MMKVSLMLQKSFLLSLIGLSLHAGGYLVSENSVNSTALSGANVAHSHGSDAAYFNPANMVFMEKQASIEATLHYFYLTSHLQIRTLQTANVPT